MQRISRPAEPKRILVIMLRRIGDVILTTPAVRALKKLYPKAQIDFLVEPPANQVLEGNPDIHSIALYDAQKQSGPLSSFMRYLHWLKQIRGARYDWVIDYMGNPRSAMITAYSGAAVRAGPGHVAHRWAYSHRLIQSEISCYTALEKIRVLKSLGLKPNESDFMPWIPSPQPASAKGEGLVIGFVPASRKVTRQWPAASYAALGRMLRDRMGARIKIFWGPGEEPLARQIAGDIGKGAEAAPQTRSLKDLSVLMNQCSLVVTNCNGPKHIAVALKIPTLTIHGSSDPAVWNPPSAAKHQTIRLDDLHCIGCRKNDCPYNLECMKNLTPEAVFAKADRMMQGAHSHGPR